MKRKRHSSEHVFLDRLHVLSLDHIGPERAVRMKEPLDVLAIILPRRLAPLQFLGSQEQLSDLDHRHGPVGQGRRHVRRPGFPPISPIPDAGEVEGLGFAPVFGKIVILARPTAKPDPRLVFPESKSVFEKG